MTSESLVDTLHNDYGHFSQCVVNSSIPYVYQWLGFKYIWFMHGF